MTNLETENFNREMSLFALGAPLENMVDFRLRKVRLLHR